MILGVGVFSLLVVLSSVPPSADAPAPPVAHAQVPDGPVVVVSMKLRDRPSDAYDRLEEVLGWIVPRTEIRRVHYRRLTPARLARLAPAALVLGPQGTPWWEYPAAELERFSATLREFSGPVLGICGGHQFLALAHGGTVAPISCPAEHDGYSGCTREYGDLPVRATMDDPLLQNLPETFVVRQSHYEEVKTLPVGFHGLASSSLSLFQVIRSSTGPVYGVQFHPEAFSAASPDGLQVLRNFLRIAGLSGPRAPLADLHCDVLMRLSKDERADIVHDSGPVSLEALTLGGGAVQIFAIFVYPKEGMDLMRAGQAQARAFRDRVLSVSRGMIRPAVTPEDLSTNLEDGVISGILAIEGAHVLGCDASNLVWYVKQGLRVLGLTWNNSNAFARGLDDDGPTTWGLTTEGERLLRLMEVHRVIADLSHAHWNTFWDTVTLTRGPVIVTHANARGVWDHERNLDDEQLLAIAEKQGLVGLCYHSRFIDGSKRASLEGLARHYEYIVATVGARHVSLGSDFGGGIHPPKGLFGAGQVPALLDVLQTRRAPSGAIEDLRIGNFLRLWQRAWDAYESIPPLDWRPLLALSVDGRPGALALFDRLRSTGLMICRDRWRFGGPSFEFRVSDGIPNALAVRIRSCSGGIVDVSVEVSVSESGDGERALGRGACPADGTRCVFSFGGEVPASAQPLRVAVEVPAGLDGCIEVQDIVPLRQGDRGPTS